MKLVKTKSFYVKLSNYKKFEKKVILKTNQN